jgi:hypothetical protein
MNATTGRLGCCPCTASGDAAAPPTSVDELPAPHSITTSARPRSANGTVMPSALAVFILMVSSTLAVCCYASWTWTWSWQVGKSPPQLQKAAWNNHF